MDAGAAVLVTDVAKLGVLAVVTVIAGLVVVTVSTDCILLFQMLILLNISIYDFPKVFSVVTHLLLLSQVHGSWFSAIYWLPAISNICI